jgi:hypothetical protein
MLVATGSVKFSGLVKCDKTAGSSTPTMEIKSFRFWTILLKQRKSYISDFTKVVLDDLTNYLSL